MDTIGENHFTSSTSHLDCVREFHEVFDHPIRTDLYESVYTENPQLVKSRISFLREERNEFINAFAEHDMVEMADALCDLIYFGYGTALCLGMNINLKFIDAHGALVDHTKSVDVFDRSVDPNMLDDTDNCTEILSRINLVSHMIDEFEINCEKSDLIMADHNLSDLVILTYQIGYYMNFDMDNMFREVHRSNMTKVCKTEADALESLRQYQKEGTYKNPVIRMKNDYYMVYDEVLNKILKFHKWESPSLAQFMGPEYAEP